MAPLQAPWFYLKIEANLELGHLRWKIYAIRRRIVNGLGLAEAFAFRSVTLKAAENRTLLGGQIRPPHTARVVAHAAG